MANALKTLFGDIANAIRDQNGDPPEVKYKPAEFPQKIADITGGGGSSADVRYVTFMSEDGSFEYGKKAVAVGDDCADPIARGVFDTPTKESTAQYTYTHYGWATTPNGAADSNWNKSITEDKTVYANFAAAVRYYTITYYDGSTVLKTESLAYGSMPNYIPEKDGYNFDGWEPALTTVTGDASYYAQFSEALTFAGASWADIAEISEAGEASKYFKVGDTKTFAYNGDTLTVAIAGFNHDDLADGSGKAGMSIVCMTLPNIKVPWAETYSSSKKYYYDNPYTFAWTNPGKLKAALDGELWDALPDALKSVIKTVSKKFDASEDSGTSPTLATSKGKLFALSMHELGYNGSATSNISTLGEKYELFPYRDLMSNNNANHPLLTVGSTTTTGGYWTRQLFRIGVFAPLRILTYAYQQQGDAMTNELYVRFGFCI